MNNLDASKTIIFCIRNIWNGNILYIGYFEGTAKIAFNIKCVPNRSSESPLVVFFYWNKISNKKVVH